MDRLNSTDKIVLVTKIFLDLNGPATAKEIVDYLNDCPIKFNKGIHIHKLSSVLRGKRQIKKEKKGKNLIYWVEK